MQALCEHYEKRKLTTKDTTENKQFMAAMLDPNVFDNFKFMDLMYDHAFSDIETLKAAFEEADKLVLLECYQSNTLYPPHSFLINFLEANSDNVTHIKEIIFACSLNSATTSSESRQTIQTPKTQDMITSFPIQKSTSKNNSNTLLLKIVSALLIATGSIAVIIAFSSLNAPALSISLMLFGAGSIYQGMGLFSQKTANMTSAVEIDSIDNESGNYELNK